MRLQLLLAILLYISAATNSHDHGENCGCPHHQMKSIPEFIPDANDTPPEICPQGHSRYIPDPNSIKPSYWDEDDDGPWEAELIENSEYTWRPRMIPNPDYIPLKPETYWNKLGENVQEAIPWVTLGIILISTLSLIPLPLDFIRNQLSGNGILNCIKAGILGLATPLCSCGSLPIAAGLVDNGIPLSSVVAFLTASQSAGIDSALITYGLLGPTAAIGRLLGALILSIVSGLVLQSTSMNSKKQHIKVMDTKPLSNSMIMHFIITLIDTTMSIFPLVLLGVAMSTAITHILPLFTLSPIQTINKYPINDFLLRIIIITSSLPLQLCEHTTAALASGIYKSGGSSGLSFAFLLTAPATNLPTLLLLARKGTGGTTISSVKVAFILSCTALVLSYIVDALDFDLGVDKGVMGDMAILPKLFVDASFYISGIFMICGMLRLVKSKLIGKEESCCHDSCEKKLN